MIDKPICMFICFLLVLATTFFNVNLLEHTSCISLLNYFHVCSGMELKGKTTFISFLCELYYCMLA